MLFHAFGVTFEGFMHLVDSKDELSSKNFFRDEIRKLDCHVHLIVVHKSDWIFFKQNFAYHSLELSADSWHMHAKEVS